MLAEGEDEDDYDPFADPDEVGGGGGGGGGGYEVMTPGISDKRMEWKEV